MAEATCLNARAQEPNQGRAINDVLRSAVVHQNLASGCPDRLAHGLKAADAGPHGHIKHCCSGKCAKPWQLTRMPTPGMVKGAGPCMIYAKLWQAKSLWRLA